MTQWGNVSGDAEGMAIGLLGIALLIALGGISVLASHQQHPPNPSRCTADVIAERGDTLFVEMRCVKSR